MVRQVLRQLVYIGFGRPTLLKVPLPLPPSSCPTCLGQHPRCEAACTPLVPLYHPTGSFLNWSSDVVKPDIRCDFRPEFDKIYGL